MAETNETTTIAADTRIKGEMTFERTVRIQGQFDGKITGKGELQVADTAVCRAEVETDNIVIDGTVEGNVKAAQRLQLNAKARLKGDIVAERLSAEEGASILGHVAVGAEAMKAAAGGAAPAAAKPAGQQPPASQQPPQPPQRK
jgi:cytoskeletal protein CcmA (bactofilin family)